MTSGSSSSASRQSASAALAAPQSSLSYVLGTPWIRSESGKGGIITIDRPAFARFTGESHGEPEYRLSRCLTTAVASINRFAASPAFLSLLISLCHSLAEVPGLNFLAAFERQMMDEKQELEQQLQQAVAQLDISLIPQECHPNGIMESDSRARVIRCNEEVTVHPHSRRHLYASASLSLTSAALRCAGLCSSCCGWCIGRPRGRTQCLTWSRCCLWSSCFTRSVVM
jgi:hypothetical protein